MKRDEAGIPEDFHITMTSRSNWLAYLLQRAITCLDQAGQKEQSDALYKADVDWLQYHVNAGRK